jgi:hypothetical protein
VNNHYLDQGLNLALRVYGPERVLPAIEKRLRYQGDVERAGVTGRRDGPTSLWSAVTVAQLRRDPRWLNVAAGLGRSRAWVVDDGDSSWRGLNPCPGHEAGPLLRDWTVVMAALAALPAKDEPPGVAPPAWVNANLPLSAEDQKTWKARQVLLALKEKDEPIRVDCAFLCHNFGLLEPTPQKVRVFAPDGRLIAEHERDIQVCYDKQRGFETMSIEIPPDGRSAGVYVLEIWTRPLALPTVAVSSTGKLVHYLPPGLRNFSSPSYAGTVWFQPRGDEDVAFAFTGLPWGRVTVLDADGKPVASSRLTGDAESRSPAAEPCRFRPAAKDERLFCAVTASTDWHRLMDVRGIKPFVATQRQAWFDPTRQTCPPLARFAEPPQAETR